MALPSTCKSRVSIMRRCAGFDAIVAASAAVQIDHHRLQSIVQTFLDNELQKIIFCKLDARFAFDIGATIFLFAFASAAFGRFLVVLLQGPLYRLGQLGTPDMR